MEIHIQPDPPFTSILFRTVVITILLIATLYAFSIIQFLVATLTIFMNRELAAGVIFLITLLLAYIIAKRTFMVEYVLTDNEIQLLTMGFKRFVPYTQIQDVILYTNPLKNRKGVADIRILTMNGETLQLADIREAENVFRILKEKAKRGDV